MFYSVIGLPGSGKSTFAAYLVRKYSKKGIKVYCNFEVKGSYLYDVNDIGNYDISNGVLILDEAGIDLNSRSYKSMSKDSIRWFKLVRHYHIKDVYVLSQGFDFDITLRRLSGQMLIIKKVGPFSKLTTWRPIWSEDEHDESGMPLIVWKRKRFSLRLFYRPRYYKYFDSYSRPELPYKDFPLLAYDTVDSTEETDSFIAVDVTDEGSGVAEHRQHIAHRSNS